MHASQSNLGSTDQILIIWFAQTVNLVRMRIQEASSAHYFWANKRWRNRKRKTVLFGLINSHSKHCDLQASHSTAQEVEARACNLHATTHINSSNASSKSQMILWLKTFSCKIARRTNLLNYNIVVFPAFWSFIFNDVRKLPHCRSVVGSSFFGFSFVFRNFRS